jgi:hypothetical protein
LRRPEFGATENEAAKRLLHLLLEELHHRGEEHAGDGGRDRIAKLAVVVM